MPILEASVERKSCAYVRATGGLALKVQAARGWPDRLIIRRDGSMFFVEFKRPGGKLTMMQQHVLGILTRMRVEAHCISNITRFREVYERV